MKMPTISIIIPVNNAEVFLPETINCIQSQTFADFEVIFVDGGSTDGSSALLKAAAEKDDRFIVLHQSNGGAGAARNSGFAAARGEYCMFMDSGSLLSATLLEKLHDAATEHQADIAVCDFGKLHPNGKVTQHEGVNARWIPGGVTAFNYRDCPDYIMRVSNPDLWNKLYRSAFIREAGLGSEESESAFVSVSTAAAGRITYIRDSLVQYRVRPANASGSVGEKLNDVRIAVTSAVRRAEELPHSDVIRSAILSYVVDNYIAALSRDIRDFFAPDAAQFYQMVHETFNQEAFADVDPRTLHNHNRFREFCTVRKHDYETMKQLVSRRLIVSLTTYPKRIGTISKVLDSLYAQSRKADEVVLWLADSQFPGKEKDLPEELLALMAENRLTVRWCDDLKPHKKYFYALQEYSNDLVVTVDDDLLYSKDMLATLYKSYLLYPDAVSTVRAHLIMISEDRKVLPYGTWIQETDACIHEPNMQLLATGGAGCLYPPNLLRKDLFDQKTIMEICPWADDLWLKAMELISEVPVVVARPHEPLCYLDGTQEEALHQLNVRQNMNDVQWEQVSRWADETFGQDILINNLTTLDIGRKILGIEAVSRHVDAERKALRRSNQPLEAKIRKAENDLRETEAKLRQLESRLRQAETKQHQAEARQHQTEAKLRKTEADKRTLREMAPIGAQYKELGRVLREQKPRGASWYCKYFIYLLAAVPEQLLLFMMYFLKNGGRQTAKHYLGKFGGRR